MNKELQQELINAIKGINDFSSEQAPEAIQQLITWEYVSFGLDLIIFPIIVYLYIRYIKFTINKKEHKEEIVNFLHFVGVVISTIMLTACSMGFICSLYDSVQAFIAPKAYILDYILGKIGGNQ